MSVPLFTQEKLDHMAQVRVVVGGEEGAGEGGGDWEDGDVCSCGRAGCVGLRGTVVAAGGCRLGAEVKGVGMGMGVGLA